MAEVGEAERSGEQGPEAQGSESVAVVSDVGLHKILGAKFDAEKDPWHLLPWGAVREVVRVLAYGAKKYAPDHWQKVPEARERYFSAAERHLIAWQQGEDRDPESGLPHLAHAACSLLFLLWFEAKR